MSRLQKTVQDLLPTLPQRNVPNYDLLPKKIPIMDDDERKKLNKNLRDNQNVKNQLVSIFRKIQLRTKLNNHFDSMHSSRA